MFRLHSVYLCSYLFTFFTVLCGRCCACGWQEQTNVKVRCICGAFLVYTEVHSGTELAGPSNRPVFSSELLSHLRAAELRTLNHNPVPSSASLRSRPLEASDLSKLLLNMFRAFPRSTTGPFFFPKLFLDDCVPYHRFSKVQFSKTHRHLKTISKKKNHYYAFCRAQVRRVTWGLCKSTGITCFTPWLN